MGWDLEAEKAKTKKIEDEARESQEEYLEVSSRSSRRPNSLAIMGETTGENKMPSIEPERSWVRDWDTMALNIDDFQSTLNKHMKAMSKFGKFERIGYDTRFRYYLGKLAEFRPSFIKTMGIEYLYE